MNSVTRFSIELGDNFTQTETIEVNVYDIKGQKVKRILLDSNNSENNNYIANELEKATVNVHSYYRTFLKKE